MGEGLMNGFDKKRLKDFRNWNTWKMIKRKLSLI
jgi:hypothetical protein